MTARGRPVSRVTHSDREDGNPLLATMEGVMRRLLGPPVPERERSVARTQPAPSA